MTLAHGVATWRRLLTPECARLLAELGETHTGAAEPALVERLRRRFPRDDVEVALELTAARRAAATKFESPERLVCDVTGVEQASGSRIARHKAARFAAAGKVVDLCCGIGGDTMALADVCSATRAVDRDPVRAWMASYNAGVESKTEDIAAGDYGDAWIHIDPDRRTGSRSTGGRRVWRYADYEPSPDVFEPLLDAAPAAAIKLAPGIVPYHLPRLDARELEFIGERRGLLQAVLWCGDLVQGTGGEHTATRLPDDSLPDGLTFRARPDRVLEVADAPGRYVLIPDPALERARLVAPRIAGTAARELAPGLGLLTADEPLDDPWFEQVEILATLPWRPKKIREWLRAHDGGPVTVRTRDRAVDTDREQVALRGDGSTPYTLFGLRLERRVVCFVTG